MSSAEFDFPSTVSRSTDLSASTAETRTGHHVYAPLSAAQVECGLSTFRAEWQHALSDLASPPHQATFDAMQVLREPMARAACAAALGELDERSRNAVAEQVLAWIDALAPVISSRRPPGRWSRARRNETRARLVLEATLATVLLRCGTNDTPQVVATYLAAGVQVPIAAGAWLLVHVAAHGDQDHDPAHVVWEALRVAPPTWITARVTTVPVDVAGQRLAAGELVLVSPLLLGRLTALVPGTATDIASFQPDRWRNPDHRPGAWLPFGAGAHACPGRNLGFGLLRDLATWAAQHSLTLADSVTIDQSRGIFPSPAHVTFLARTQ